MESACSNRSRSKSHWNPARLVFDVASGLLAQVGKQLAQELDGSEPREQVCERIRELVQEKFAL